MAKVYRNMLINKTSEKIKTLADVPTKYKEAVKALLKQDVANGVITEVQYKEITNEDYVAETTTDAE